MVLGSKSFGNNIELYFPQSDSLAAKRYLDEILRHLVLWYAVTVGEFIYTDDYSRPDI